MKSSPTLVESLRKSAEERPLTRYLMNEAADAIEKLTEELQIRSLTADASLHVANAPQVPEDFALVPVRPTVGMYEAFAGKPLTYPEWHKWLEQYKAMLSAAPQPEQKG